MNIKSISEAARIAGTSRQNIDNKKAFPDKWDFFTTVDGVQKVDVDHQDFIRFVEMIKANKRKKEGLPKDPDPFDGIDRFSLFYGAVENVLFNAWGDQSLVGLMEDVTEQYNLSLKKITGE